jgi:hypothetical protein
LIQAGGWSATALSWTRRSRDLRAADRGLVGMSGSYRRGTHFLSRLLARRASEPSESTTMQQPGLDNRHRDKNGEISRKHGNT